MKNKIQISVKFKRMLIALANFFSAFALEVLFNQTDSLFCWSICIGKQCRRKGLTHQVSSFGNFPAQLGLVSFGSPPVEQQIFVLLNDSSGNVFNVSKLCIKSSLNIWLTGESKQASEAAEGSPGEGRLLHSIFAAYHVVLDLCQRTVAEHVQEFVEKGDNVSFGCISSCTKRLFAVLQQLKRLHHQFTLFGGVYLELPKVGITVHSHEKRRHGHVSPTRQRTLIAGLHSVSQHLETLLNGDFCLFEGESADQLQSEKLQLAEVGRRRAGQLSLARVDTGLLREHLTGAAAEDCPRAVGTDDESVGGSVAQAAVLKLLNGGVLQGEDLLVEDHLTGGDATSGGQFVGKIASVFH